MNYKLYGAGLVLLALLGVVWGLRASSTNMQGEITAVSCVDSHRVFNDGTHNGAMILHCVVAVCQNGQCHLEDDYR